MIRSAIKGAWLVSAALGCAGCQQPSSAPTSIGGVVATAPVAEVGLYSLYRNSVTDSTARYYIAVFDAPDGEDYNRENCEVARSLFQSQAGVRTHFWCQPGRAK